MAKNRARLGRRIRSLSDRSSDYDMARACRDRLCRGNDPDLITDATAGGRTPGVTIANSLPSLARNVEASRAEVTIP